MFISQVADDQEFDITLPGPWMRKWEIVNHNSHVRKHTQMEKDGKEKDILDKPANLHNGESED